MRRRPTTKLEIFGPLCPMTPMALIHQSGESDINAKTLIKPPRHEAKEDSVELSAINTGEEHRKMLLLQSQMIQNNEIQANVNNNRITQLHEEVAILRENLIDMNIFMQSCDEKKRMANKAINKEKLSHEELKAESAELVKLIDVMTKFRKDLLKTINELEHYERRLEETIGIQNVWFSAEDCLLRCDALMLTQVEILKMRDEKIARMEEIRIAMGQLTSTSMAAILGLNTAMNNLERDLVHARNTCVNWEKILANIKDTVAKQELEREMMIDAIDVLYRTICARKNTPPVMSLEGRSMERRLNFIREEALIFQAVHKLCRAEMERQERARLRRK